MKNAIQLLAACAALALASSTFATENHAGGHDHGGATLGQPGIAGKVTRTIAIDMRDSMRFSPSEVRVGPGETVRFVVTNSGKIPHEFQLGTEAELKAHQARMASMPGMVHAEPSQVSVAPGQTGAVIWQFASAGTVRFACLYPGHYEAGMQGTVQVGAKP